MDWRILFEYERGKSIGILNGIDTDVWDPQQITTWSKNYDKELVEKGKKKNKKEICGQFGLDPDKPLDRFYRPAGRRKGCRSFARCHQSIYLPASWQSQFS